MTLEASAWKRLSSRVIPDRGLQFQIRLVLTLTRQKFAGATLLNLTSTRFFVAFASLYLRLVSYAIPQWVEIPQ